MLTSPVTTNKPSQFVVMFPKRASIRSNQSVYLKLDIKLLKVYMTYFFLICSIKSPQCADNYRNFFFDSDFPSPCFDVPKASNFTSGGVQNRDTKNRRLGTIVTSIHRFQKKPEVACKRGLIALSLPIWRMRYRRN